MGDRAVTNLRLLAGNVQLVPRSAADVLLIYYPGRLRCSCQFDTETRCPYLPSTHYLKH